MTILEATYKTLLEKKSTGMSDLSEYLGDHIGRDSIQHFMSYSTGAWLGGLLTLDNGVTIDSYHGKLEHNNEIYWIDDSELESMLDDIFFTLWEYSEIDPLDIIEEL